MIWNDSTTNAENRVGRATKEREFYFSGWCLSFLVSNIAKERLQPTG
jgi:hypothetical protein